MNKLAAFIYVRGLVEEDAPREKIIDLAAMVDDSIRALITDLEGLADDAAEELIQSVFYEAGKRHFSGDLRFWFKVLYQMLLGQMDGPRLGQFTRIMTIDWITHKLARSVEDHWQIS